MTCFWATTRHAVSFGRSPRGGLLITVTVTIITVHQKTQRNSRVAAGSSRDRDSSDGPGGPVKGVFGHVS